MNSIDSAITVVQNIVDTNFGGSARAVVKRDPLRGGVVRSKGPT
jgi:hypothetical protein